MGNAVCLHNSGCPPHAEQSPCLAFSIRKKSKEAGDAFAKDVNASSVAPLKSIAHPWG